MEKHEIKDKILNHIANSNSNSFSTHQLSIDLNIQWELVYGCCLEMSNVMHVDATQVQGNYRHYELSIKKHPKGVAFLKFGGYTEKNKKDILPSELANSTIKTNRNITIISTLSFLVVLVTCFISYLQYSKVSEVSIKQLDSLKTEFRKYQQNIPELKNSSNKYLNYNKNLDSLKNVSRK